MVHECGLPGSDLDRLEKVRRYYSGVRRRRTTICCSAIALTAGASLLAAAQMKLTGPADLGLFPTRPAWTLPLNAALTTTPVFSGARGYFPIEDDRLAAYDLSSGTLRWVQTVQAKDAPALGDGLIFTVEATAITALRQDDGSVAWQLPFVESLAAPLVWNTGWLVAATTAGSILAFRAADGELIWRQDLRAPVHAPPSIAGEHVYAPLDDATLVALRVDNGATLWERRLGGPPNEVLAADDRLYVGSDDNYLYCLRMRDGEVDWRWRTGGDVEGMPVADERLIYFVSYDNVLRGLDQQTGAQRWKRALPLRPTSGLARAGDTLLVSGAAPKVFAYFLKDGTPAGEIAAPGELAGAPHVSNFNGLPMVTVAARDVVKGTVVSSVIRSIEPPTSPVGPLPNPIALPPPQSARPSP
jgi:outer membrane protein assembly factor BamB